MSHFGKITLCSVIGICFVARAEDVGPAYNPYSEIADRNVFSLSQPSPPAPFLSPTESPPKIMPDGIITIFGRPQVLFKVVSLQNSPGTRTSETSCVLSAGEQQDGVKVLQIDTVSGVVTFDNHGVIQKIPLVNFSVTATGTKPPPTPAQILFNLSNQGR